jgi:hypothetical protein
MIARRFARYAPGSKKQTTTTKGKIMNITKETKLLNATRAAEILGYYRDELVTGNAILAISQETSSGLTDYLRVTIAYTEDGIVKLAGLSWELGQVLGYRIADRAGQYCLALGGGFYSKPLDVAVNLARYYGVNDYAIRYETH